MRFARRGVISHRGRKERGEATDLAVVIENAEHVLAVFERRMVRVDLGRGQFGVGAGLSVAFEESSQFVEVDGGVVLESEWLRRHSAILYRTLGV
jgi:hypothetical protein